MGYYVNGSLRVSFTETTLVLIELRMNELANIVQTKPVDGTTIQKIVDFLGMDCEDDIDQLDQLDRDDNGVITIFCYTDKWRSHNDAVITWLAECGVGIAGMFTGEDESMWGYNTLANSYSHIEYGLVPTPTNYVKACDALVDYIKANGVTDEISVELAELLHNTVTNYVDSSVMS